MTIGVFTLVLIAALCHAIWNTIIKLSPDKSLETSLMNLSGSLIAIPAVLYFGIPESEVWIFFAWLTDFAYCILLLIVWSLSVGRYVAHLPDYEGDGAIFFITDHKYFCI